MDDFQALVARQADDRIVASSSPDFTVGDAVLAHGYEIGTGRHGGYAQYARVPADEVVALGSLSPHEGAAVGTAGFTAAMSPPIRTPSRERLARPVGPVRSTASAAPRSRTFSARCPTAAQWPPAGSRVARRCTPL